MTTPFRTEKTLADDIIRQVDELIQQAQRDNKPLEVDPARSRLFELFVTADGAGYLQEEGPVDLTADSFCKTLAARWGLDSAAQDSVAHNSEIPKDSLAQMRLLWSFLRMWMEWTYAWQRWQEFHE
ncbi:MAG: hypothetical protein ACK5Q5_04180 [Planctomycetaceae bacterium]